MDDELQIKIFREYPEFFKYMDNMRISLMCFGIECGNGWYNLIYELCGDIKSFFMNEYMDEDGKHGIPEYFYVEQIKEKFGSLRFYVSCAPKEVYDMINNAEDKSFCICEICGDEARYRDELCWIRTLCDKCLKEHLKSHGLPVSDCISSWQKKQGAPYIKKGDDIDDE